MASHKPLPCHLTNFNICYLVVVSILCSFFYLMGLSKYGTGGGATVISGFRCIPNETQTPVLDFSSHHTFEDFREARIQHVPPCDAKYSEYTPCEDVERSLKFERERFVYRERHCPAPEEILRCRIPAPYGYKTPFRWPAGRDSVWYHNVPHKELTVEKAGQNWVRFQKDRFTFPGGGTMFPRGADAYIDQIGKLINLTDGSIRTAIDTGCGVASWGAYLLSRQILTVSVAPKDTHEAQVQFALERGVPALIGILASKRLPYPSRAFDMAHCSRCLIPWAKYDGQYLIEIDRILRPGGYWILSGPPINWETHWKGWGRTKKDLQEEEFEIETVARSLCWKRLVKKGDISIWEKATNHIHCKINRKILTRPQFCRGQDPDMAWYTRMDTCLTPLPEASDIKEIAGGKLTKWPERLYAVPPRISNGTLEGITAQAFKNDTKLWKKRVLYYKTLNKELEQQGRYRNLLDMNAHLGGFAAAMAHDPVWVMNIVPVQAKINTLGVIYERGLIGTYQNWCEAMSTYPRTYDFIHADSVFTLYENRCKMEDIVLEMDRILRPEGSVIFRDDIDMLMKVKDVIDGMNWESRIIDHEDGPFVREKILLAVKLYWALSGKGDS